MTSQVHVKWHSVSRSQPWHSILCIFFNAFQALERKNDIEPEITPTKTISDRNVLFERCLGVVSILIPGNIVTYIDCRPRIALREQTLKVNVTYVRLVCHVACVWFLQYHHYPRNKNEIRQKEAKKEEKGRWKKTKYQLLQFGIIFRASVLIRLPFFKV